MITCPVIHGPSTTVGQLRRFFDDDHSHMALLAEAGKLIGAVERADLRLAVGDGVLARSIASLDRRTIRPDTPLTEALALMKRDHRRRLAVTTVDLTLLGLLCLKASGLGFCSDADVRSRADLREVG